MTRKAAQYVLRIDDLCPTVAAGRWAQWRALLAEFALRPILAVVPDNRDPELQASPPDADFWAQMRALEAAGSAIALHGYRHLCASRGRSLVALHRNSEFAGVAEQTQRAWIAEGLAILRGHGLHPKLWVAPRHGFDAATLRALREEGIVLVSDGFARRPFLRDGVTWIPQQIWGPVEKESGLWTLCVHPATATDGEMEALRRFLGRHAGEFVSVEGALAGFPPTRLRLAERLQAEGALRRLRLAHALRPVRRRLRRCSSSSV